MCCEYGPWVRIHNTSFSLQLMHWPNKLGCYITQDLNDLSGTNALAYCGHFELQNKLLCCEYAPWKLNFVEECEEIKEKLKCLRFAPQSGNKVFIKIMKEAYHLVGKLLI
jgi:hypothetical protein